MIYMIQVSPSNSSRHHDYRHSGSAMLLPDLIWAYCFRNAMTRRRGSMPRRRSSNRSVASLSVSTPCTPLAISRQIRVTPQLSKSTLPLLVSHVFSVGHKMKPDVVLITNAQNYELGITMCWQYCSLIISHFSSRFPDAIWHEIVLCSDRSPTYYELVEHVKR